MSVRLAYAFDPLCGWCYGFAPAFRAVRAAFPDLPIELRFGGLVTGHRIGPYSDKRAYIEAAQERLTAVTGVSLGQAFHARILRNPRAIASSIPPCDVLLQLRSVAPLAVPDFADAIQTAHFHGGADYNDPAIYTRIANLMGLDFSPDVPFPDALSPELTAEFNATKALGVSSYPTLMILSDDKLETVQLDYRPAQQVDLLGRALAGRPHTNER